MTRIPVADRRTALVQAALRVIARDGVAAATTRRIVAEARMPLASFHYVFESRDELMAELIEAAVGSEQTDFAPALTVEAGGAGMRDAVRAGLQHYFDGVRADPGREKAMFELTHWALREPGFEPLARRQYARYHEVAAHAAAETARLAGYEWTRPLDEIARILVSFTDGLTVGWLVTRDDAAAAAVMDVAADALAALAVPTSEPHHRTTHHTPAPSTNAGAR
ncbi:MULTISPECIES: TetR family transcriptional regulator C-terminal domain-containing protein [unclassified Leifsonia]|uniref:TetR/AcrR family transcriptional regulator n=1 Tax=unclassified Leifsonia TaxID=2663824 RepID=UPI002856B3F5|nr:TetR family transcriptional regulator C-terminal domain-containing protein [Leifsonia sp. 1010]MDR6614141.1 AcrR family transcriptional regulator [Leifsonia sp. 1010]